MKISFVILLTLVTSVGFCDQIQFEVDKSDPRYVDYVIPEAERSFTSDFRRITLRGKRFDKPLIVSAESDSSLPKPFDLLAKYLRANKDEDIATILSLYNDEGRKIIESASEDQVRQVMGTAAAVDFYEIYMVIENGADLIGYGYQYQNSSRSLTRVRFTRFGDLYYMAAGLSKESMKFDLLLNGHLATHGFDGLRVLRAQSVK